MRMMGFVSVAKASALVAIVITANFGLRAQGQGSATLMDSAAVPRFGTFWSAAHLNQPPTPMDPFQGALPVYAISGKTNVFVIDDRDVDFQAWYAGIAAGGSRDNIPMKGTSLALSSALAASSAASTTDLSGPPIPPGATSTNTDSDLEQFTFSPMVYGAQDLWLSVSVTNTSAYFVIHTPDSNGMYDLFGTGNLAPNAPNAPGLNRANWAWLGRTTAGQTNCILSNIWSTQGFFRLGTMLDSNSDGITDAYSNLIGLNSNSDLDGDGVSDVEEMREGRNPMIPGAVGDTNSVARLDVFTVLR